MLYSFEQMIINTEEIQEIQFTEQHKEEKESKKQEKNQDINEDEKSQNDRIKE